MADSENWEQTRGENEHPLMPQQMQKAKKEKLIIARSAVVYVYNWSGNSLSLLTLPVLWRSNSALPLKLAHLAHHILGVCCEARHSLPLEVAIERPVFPNTSHLFLCEGVGRVGASWRVYTKFESHAADLFLRCVMILQNFKLDDVSRAL